MGFFWQGLPPYVIEWSKQLLGTGVVAVETGTFEGDTSLLLADAFGACVTIERSETLAAAAQRRFAKDQRVQVLQGSSRDRLREAVPGADRPAFFWLDAHGFYDYVGADGEENPLLEELRVIMEVRGSAPAVIAVDDARGMGVQPDWPSVSSITGALAEGGFASAIIDDVLVAAPASLAPDFYGLYQNSRVVEVSALFHVWSQVRAVVSTRKLTDKVVIKLKG